MAVKFEFYLSDNDFDRLFALKQKNNKRDLSGNEYAQELLEKELHRLHPSIPDIDENGDYI